MPRPSQFQVSSDFTTMKNDGSDMATIVIPGSSSITGSGTLSLSADLTIGSQGAFSRGRINSTRNSSKWYTTNHASFSRTGTFSGSPSTYDISAFFWRPNATTLRCQVHIQNPYSGTLTTAAGDETISFYVNTFIPPFE